MTDSHMDPSSRKVALAKEGDPLIGTLIADRYRVLQIIGKGGMGVVFKAKHEALGRMVAIKILLPHLASDEQSHMRFQREAKTISKLQHPNVVSLYDYGLLDKATPYLVMAYLDGRSLSQEIKKLGQLPVDRVIDIFIQVADALSHAHKAGIIHRDMKPGNIMLVNEPGSAEYVQIVDFGIAKLCGGDDEAQKLTKTGEICGSPVYMSPEQLQGFTIGPTSEIYSVGCVMYEALTGKPPFMGQHVVETVTKHLQTPPDAFAVRRPDLLIPKHLEDIVRKTLEKAVEDRHQSMEELKKDLLCVKLEMIAGASQIWPASKNPAEALPDRSGSPGQETAVEGTDSEIISEATTLVDKVDVLPAHGDKQAASKRPVVILLAVAAALSAIMICSIKPPEEKPGGAQNQASNSKKQVQATAKPLKSKVSPSIAPLQAVQDADQRIPKVAPDYRKPQQRQPADYQQAARAAQQQAAQQRAAAIAKQEQLRAAAIRKAQQAQLNAHAAAIQLQQQAMRQAAEARQQAARAREQAMYKQQEALQFQKEELRLQQGDVHRELVQAASYSASKATHRSVKSASRSIAKTAKSFTKHFRSLINKALD